jgi:hypothetical protein
MEMGKNRNRQPATLCADITTPLRAALDAGNVATAATLLHDRPECPTAVETDVYRLPEVDGRTFPGIFGECAVCDALLEMFCNHPLAPRVVDALREARYTHHG